MTNRNPCFQVARLIERTAAESVRRVYIQADLACALIEPLQQLADCLQAAGQPFQMQNFTGEKEIVLLLTIETVEQDMRTDRALAEFSEDSGWTLRCSGPEEVGGINGYAVAKAWLHHPAWPAVSQRINLVIHYSGENHV